MNVELHLRNAYNALSAAVQTFRDSENPRTNDVRFTRDLIEDMLHDERANSQEEMRAFLDLIHIRIHNVCETENTIDHLENALSEVSDAKTFINSEDEAEETQSQTSNAES